MSFSEKQAKQEAEYSFPYHYLDLVEGFRLIEYNDYIKIVRKLLGNIENKKILDAGCGDGRFCFELLKEKADITGIDYSQRAINFARAFNPQGNFICNDLAKLSSKEKFDSLVSIETIEHIKPTELKKMIKTFHNLLNENGNLIITVPSKNVKVGSKHYQHFFLPDLENYLQDYFKIETAFGHGSLKTIPNKLFKILLAWNYLLEGLKVRSKLKSKQNLTKFYRKHLSKCKVNKSKRLIVLARKK